MKTQTSQFHKFRGSTGSGGDATNVNVSSYTWKVISHYSSDTRVKQRDKYLSQLGHTECKEFLYLPLPAGTTEAKSLLETLEIETKKKAP